MHQAFLEIANAKLEKERELPSSVQPILAFLSRAAAITEVGAVLRKSSGIVERKDRL